MVTIPHKSKVKHFAVCRSFNKLPALAFPVKISPRSFFLPTQDYLPETYQIRPLIGILSEALLNRFLPGHWHIIRPVPINNKIIGMLNLIPLLRVRLP